MTNSADCCACVALDCIIKDIAKQVTAAKQVLTVAGDLRPGRARKRDPMVSLFRYGKGGGSPRHLPVYPSSSGKFVPCEGRASVRCCAHASTSASANVMRLLLRRVSAQLCPDKRGEPTHP